MDHHLTPLDVTQLPTWKGLRQHRQDLAGFSLRQAFADAIYAEPSTVTFAPSGRQTRGSAAPNTATVRVPVTAAR